ncbi:MAG: pyridoxamine 5'-phosphate oxidase family protein [Lachnospiraceae bacterium]|nr:pyridoxamine 5'-phosphate oxidase family protein [Lachnospiraceae bacterium]MCR5338659.1 pyridoxamine 5'-phosphate oxidase family protein [Lachnospiraceae bacterium]
MALTNEQIENYLKSTKRILLATVTEDGKADVRILGAIATDGFKTYFSTADNARKVKQIEKNPDVAIYFEAPGQEFPNYINATVYGKAKKVTCDKGLEKAKALIKEKLPKFEFTPEKSIFVVEPETVKIYNSSAELAQDKIQIVTV